MMHAIEYEYNNFQRRNHPKKKNMRMTEIFSMGFKSFNSINDKLLVLITVNFHPS